MKRWFTSDIFKEILAKAAASNGCATGRQWGRASFCSCACTSAGAGVVSAVSVKGGLEDARRCAPSEEISLRRVASSFHPRVTCVVVERTNPACQTVGSARRRKAVVVQEGIQTHLGVGEAGWASTMRTGTFLAGAGAMGFVGVAAGTGLALGPADLCEEKAPGLCNFLRESWCHSQLSATHEQSASRRLSKIFFTGLVGLQGMDGEESMVSE